MPHIKVKSTGKVVEVSDTTAAQMVPRYAERVDAPKKASKAESTSAKSEDK